MKYFKNPTDGLVYAYDSASTNDAPSITKAIASGWTDITGSWPPAPTLAETQAAQIAIMQKAYDTALVSNITYMGATFQADLASQNLITQVITASGGTLPAGFAWYDITNTPITMTYAQLQGMAALILGRGQPLFTKLQTRKASIRAATTIAAVQAVVW